MGQPAYVLNHYQFQENGSDCNTSTLLGSEDTSNSSLSLDTTYFLRVKIYNNGAKTQSADFRLECDVDGGGYNAVTTSSSNVRAVDGGDTDGDAVTERLTDDGYAYANGQYSEDGEVTGYTLAHSPVGTTELVYAIQFRSADLTTGSETVTFRVSDAGVVSNFTYPSGNGEPTAVMPAGPDQTASGSPTLGAVTSTGSATRIVTASGTPSIAAVTSAGSSPRVLVNSSESTTGAVPQPFTAYSDTSITLGALRQGGLSTGTMYVAVQATSSSGPQLSNWYSFTASSGADQTASGSPSIGAVTSTGTATRIVTASGTPSIGAVTATGSATRIVTASGTPTLGAVTAAGAAARILTAAGAITLAACTATGSATRIVTASGSPSIAAVTSTGAAERVITASGSPSIAAVTASGTAYFLWDASGTPTIAAVTATGTATKGDEKTASGSPSLGAVTATGAATRIVTGSGTPSIGATTASGTAERIITSAGTPSLGAVTATGQAQRVVTGTGTPSLGAVTGSGSATRIVTGSGTPSLAAVTASGAALRKVTASGTPSIGAVTSTGVAAVSGSHTASGSPSLGAVTATGTAERIVTASGSPSIGAVTSSGSAAVSGDAKTASGSPSIGAVTGSGSATKFDGLFQVLVNSSESESGAVEQTVTDRRDDAVTLGPLKRGSLGTGTHYIRVKNSGGDSNWYAFTAAYPAASGSPSIAAVTSAGTATVPPKTLTASGSPSIAAVTATGGANPGDKAVYINAAASKDGSEVAQPIQTWANDEIVLGPLNQGGLGTHGDFYIAAENNGVLTNWYPFVIADEASGGGSISVPTATGNAVIGDIPQKLIYAVGSGDSIESGEADISGSDAITKTASGSPSIGAVRASGSAKIGWKASGTPSLGAVTSSGAAKLGWPASGTPSIAAVTAAGAASVSPDKSGSGTAFIAAVTASGSAARVVTATGSPSIGAVTATGTAKPGWKATGAPSIGAVTATGTAEHTKIVDQAADGSPSIPAITATGVATRGRTASATLTTDRAAVAGSGTVGPDVPTIIRAEGEITLGAITGTGTGIITRKASGESSIEGVTASGACEVRNPDGTLKTDREAGWTAFNFTAPIAIFGRFRPQAEMTTAKAQSTHESS